MPAAIEPAHAQNNSPVNRPLSQGTQQLKAKTAAGLGAASGYTVFPGLVVTPTGFVEGGYDSNPDELDGPKKDAAYSRTGAGLGITAIGEKTAANVNLAGSWVDLDADIERSQRYNASATADVVQALAPGLTISAGGLFEYDGFDYTENQVAGAYTELGYETDFLTAFTRGRTTEVRYLNDHLPPANASTAILPLFRTSAFDVRRDEVGAGVLAFNQQFLSPYVEGNAAKLDYLDQRAPSLVDRDADDYFWKGGMRVTFSPALRADIGWRWNDRQLDDPTIKAFSSDYFDGSVTWAPTGYFSLTGAIDRTIAEPLGALGRLADVKSYRAGIRYQPFDRVSLALDAKRESLEDIGSGLFYRVHEVQGEAAYQAASWAQFYTGLYYEHVEEDRNDSDYERFKVGSGLRIKLGGGMAGANDPFVLPFTQASTWHGPTGSTLTVSSGASWFHLPEKAMTTTTTVLADIATGQIVDHDGDVGGERTDIRLDDAARFTTASGTILTFGFAGFYGDYAKTDHSSCNFTATTDCIFVNIDDFDPAEENNTGAFGKLQTSTERDVHYWGVASDAKFSWKTDGNAKGAAVVTSSPFRLGVDVRGLHERTRLFSFDTSVPDPVDYRETLDTYYFGSYVGYAAKQPIGGGLTLSFDSMAGLYYAHSTYEGRYFAFIPAGGSTYVLERGAVDDAHESAAFIGDATVTLSKAFSWGQLGVYAQGEYLSYAPQVLYNNNDEAGGLPFGVIGTQKGTRLISDDAFNYTLGLTAAIPFN